jgi:hypothetical protein
VGGPASHGSTDQLQAGTEFRLRADQLHGVGAGPVGVPKTAAMHLRRL